jgi:glyceraldehyde 3-phosphate dehydrogenase
MTSPDNSTLAHPLKFDSILGRLSAAEGLTKGILKYYDAPIVSSDIVTDPHSSIFDSGLTKVIDNQAEVVSWYDTEWGHTNRLIDLVTLVGRFLSP